MHTSVFFAPAGRVKNVKIGGFEPNYNSGPGMWPPWSGSVGTINGEYFGTELPREFYGLLTLEYDEIRVKEKILRFDHGEVPEFLTNAGAELVNGTPADIKLDYDAGGTLKSLVMPEVKLTVQNEAFTVGMKADAVDFDVAGAENRTELGEGLYGYDFSWEETDGKYVMSAYLDTRLLERPVTMAYGAKSMRALSAAGSGLKFAKVVIETAGDVDKVTTAYGDLSKAAKTAQLRDLLEQVRPNLQPNVADYYESQLQRMGKEYMMGKTLGFVGDSVSAAGSLVPLLGEVVVGVAGMISGKLLNDMFDNEFDSDYGRMMAMLRNEPGGTPSVPGNSGDAGWNAGDFQNNMKNYQFHSHLNELNSIDHGDYWHSWTNVAMVNSIQIVDPSGFVYEAVEDNRIEDVTATALYLPQGEAQTAEEAKASDQWQVWNAEMFFQENPQKTTFEGKYAWDVPDGWWMVQFEKDGYETTYSDALPVPPPQLEVNVPMVKLERPAVENTKTVWGNGGRYVDIYFSKYMDMKTFEMSNAVSITDANGNAAGGAVVSAIPEKTGVHGLSLTKIVRFVPDVPLISGGQYTLTVNKSVADYAGFCLTDNYTETGTIPAAAAIGSMAGTGIAVEPGLDITEAVHKAVAFTAVDPAAQNRLDRRMVFSSSNEDVVKIWENGTITSMAEGTVLMTVLSMDDGGKKAEFHVTVASEPGPVSVANMTVLDSNGKVLTDLSLRNGDNYTLNPRITPENAANKKVAYSSDNLLVADVSSSGVITPVSEGIAVITVVSESQNIRHRIHVTVLPKQQGSVGNGSFTAPAVSRPAASMPGGKVEKGTAVTLSTQTAGAVIYYTLDGSIPTNRATLYGEPIVIEKDTVLKAIAIKSGMADSEVMTVSYTVEEKAPAFVFRFSDVNKTDWFYNAVYFAAEKDITSGVSQKRFAPHKTATRAEFITLLCKAYGIERRTGDNFDDGGDTWYTGYLAAAKQLGISMGTGQNKFEPDREITRQEMVVLMYNCLQALGKIDEKTDAVELGYADKDSIAEWAVEAVSYAFASGWVSGRGNNRFAPQAKATRAELVQVFYNMLK